jgi:hypothetical protein
MSLGPGVASRDVSRLSHLSFRVAEDYDPVNPANPAPQDFTVRLKDARGATSVGVAVSDWKGIHFPVGPNTPLNPLSILETVRIPLDAFAGVNLARVTGIRFEFDRVSAGAIALADVAFQPRPTTHFVDAYRCDSAHNVSSATLRVIGVRVVDDLEDATFDLVRRRALCVPASTTAADVVDGTTHLYAYAMRPSLGSVASHRGIRIDDDIGSFVVDTTGAPLLLVPSNVGAGIPVAPDPTRHSVADYHCYRTRHSRGSPRVPRGTVVTLRSGGAPTTVELRKVAHICRAASVAGAPLRNAGGQLTCYALRRSPVAPSVVGIANRFDTGTATVSGAHEVCIPSLAVR